MFPLLCLPLPVHSAHDNKVHADTNHYGHHHSKCNQPHLNRWVCGRSQCGTQAFKLQRVICQLKNPIDATSGMPTNMWGRGGGGGRVTASYVLLLVSDAVGITLHIWRVPTHSMYSQCIPYNVLQTYPQQ